MHSLFTKDSLKLGVQGEHLGITQGHCDSVLGEHPPGSFCSILMNCGEELTPSKGNSERQELISLQESSYHTNQAQEAKQTRRDHKLYGLEGLIQHLLLICVTRYIY